MRRNIPSLQSLIFFESAARHSSYTHASLELCITQSAVSRQVQQLEDFLGISLFTRTRHGVELTYAGQQYAKNVRPYLTGLEKMTSDMISHKGQGGTLKLGVVPTFATRWLLPRLHRFNVRHPEITVHLETSTKPFLFDDNIFDAAIYAGTQQQIDHWPGTQTHFLMQEDLVAVCSPQLIQQHFPDAVMNGNGSFNLTPSELIHLPLLQQTTRPAIWQEWFQTHQTEHPRPHDGQRHELFSMLSVAASHGMGMALIPQMLIEQELTTGQLAIVSSAKLQGSRSYYMVHAVQQSSPLIQKFTAWLKSELHPSSVNDLTDYCSALKD